MKIEAVIFDFDGVLFDSEPFHFGATQTVLAELEFALTYDFYKQNFTGRADPHIFKDFLEKNGHDASQDNILKMIQAKMDAYRHLIDHQVEVNAIEGAFHFLQHVAKKIDKFAVCSNGNRPDFDLVFHKLEGGALAQFFKFTITVNDVKHGKPEPEGYLAAAARLGVKPEHCLVIEDSKTGMTAAKRAGTNVVGITTSYPAAELAQLEPVFIADTYQEIEQWLNATAILGSSIVR